MNSLQKIPNPSNQALTEPLVQLSSENELPESQAVFEEPVVFAAAMTSLLLQVANPPVARAIVAHSRVFHRPVSRLSGTIAWIYLMNFGTSDEKAAIARVVDATHGKVKGPSYNANDPELQMWLAACIYACSLRVYEDALGPFDEFAADRYYHQAFYHATYLRVPREMIPTDRQSFWVYWNKQIEQLEVTDDAQTLAGIGLWGQGVPLWAWPILPLVRIIAAEHLPGRIRDAYGLKRKAFIYNVGFQATRYGISCEKLGKAAWRDEIL
ncbi:uncharacterized protein N7484_006000 [Penicillium longicatenatum]|uniref:uncharacterized protein n=1 Tax=Penicillium longicatenatum TaxID=1561947 RepID=UPI0025486775|nr:uncharacterized protein N7484_006000 [Penicillium longicatenatum]KAJ5643493.1 hypothetical protein N7484_006000 [Penicillium longicatenatum]